MGWGKIPPLVPAVKNLEFFVLFSLIFPTFWVSPSQMNEVFHSNIQEGIRHYYDDLDFKNILDFVQEKVWMGRGGSFPRNDSSHAPFSPVLSVDISGGNFLALNIPKWKKTHGKSPNLRREL